jgi:hypothetical protein
MKDKAAGTTDQFVSDVVSSRRNGAREVFVIEPPDGVAAVLPPLIPSYPPGIEVFFEPRLQNGVAILAKVRDAGGEVIGFASELEEVNLLTAVTNTVWTLYLPGRGVLFLSQQEDLAPLLAIVFDMFQTGDLERSFDPPLELVDTIGAGVIVGGTGEFEKAKGTFRELATLYRVSLIAGELPLVARLVLELNFVSGIRCPGDCDGDGQAGIAELVRGVSIALGSAAIDACAAFDANGNGTVTIDELVQGINSALAACAH